jgi:polyferredoxin
MICLIEGPWPSCHNKAMDRLRVMRRATQMGFIAVIFLLPVFDILRYDAASRELYILGSVWSLGLREGFYLDRSFGGSTYVALHFFLKAILPWVVVLSVFPVLGAFLGRFFCGWLCPEGTLFELADFLGERLFGRRTFFGRDGHGGNGRGERARNRLPYALLAALALVAVPPLFGVALSQYFIAPEKVWRQVATLELSPGLKAGIIGVSAYMLITSVLVRHALCKYVCAAGLMQMLFGWASPVSLGIRFDRARSSACTDCRGCDRACFMNVKPRSPKRDINCVNCGECISACKRELGPEALFSYGFGANGARDTAAGKTVYQEGETTLAGR